MFVRRPLRSPRIIALALLAAVTALLALNMYRSYSLGQYRTMYDNPIYRWRVSLAVSLSQLRDPPLAGYVAYGSIDNYLNQHGLALIEGEAAPMPSIQSVIALVRDPARLEKLILKASAIPIDPTLPSVPIVGNEKGEAAYFYWAFRLFGIHLTALWWFYFVLLATGTLLFFFAFWRSPVCMLLLMVYLIAHLYMVGIASHPIFHTVHNSRFFTVLALLPSLHLLLLTVRRERPSLSGIILAAGQVLLLFFAIFCRVQAAWQPAAVVTATLFVLPYRPFWQALRQRVEVAGAARGILVAAWPAALVIAGAAGFVGYQRVALDSRSYATETTTHTFWDPVLSGMISANSELTALYGLGQEPYSDTMTYFIARKYLRDHNDIHSPIVEIKGGLIEINAMRNMGAYDHILKKILFQLVRDHPLLVLKSTFFDKIRDQTEMLWHMRIFYLKSFVLVMVLAAGSSVLLMTFGVTVPPRPRQIAVVELAGLTGLFSLSTTFITPSPMILDTITVFLMILLLVPTYALILIGDRLRQGRRAVSRLLS